MRAFDSIVLTPEVSVTLQRTLRIPDDGRDYPLPPGLGRLPVKDTGEGLVVPMHVREAMWLSFDAPYWKPHALKVGIGGIDALTGESFDPDHLSARPQDYVVIPDQPWLDGINAGDGFIRQFVAVALGEGLSVEADLTGEESHGGLQLSLFAPRPGRFPDSPPKIDPRYETMCCVQASSEMGLGAGGRMRQEIYEDDYGLDTWERKPAATVEVTMLEAHAFAERFGVPVPPTPVDAATYTEHGLPWFDLYDPVRRAIPKTDRLAGVRSVRDRAGEESDAPVAVEDDQTVVIANPPVTPLSDPTS